MGIFDVNETTTTTGSNWNYHDPNKPDYMNTIAGTVVEIHSVYATKFNSNEIDRFPDGNPKINLVLVIQGQSGRELRWTVSGGKKGLAYQALVAGMPGINSILEYAGKMIQVSTQQGVFNSQRPRPWTVQVLGEGTVPYRGTFDDTQAQLQGQQQQQAQPQPQMNNAFAAPVQQQQPVQQQPVNNGFAAPLNFVEQTPQQPQVQQQQPVIATVYDDEIPF